MNTDAENYDSIWNISSILQVGKPCIVCIGIKYTLKGLKKLTEQENRKKYI